MKTRLASLVHHLEEVGGPAQQQTHHPHVAGETSKMQRRVS